MLAITDPIMEKKDHVMKKKSMANADGFGEELQKPILCISLSEKFDMQNACYKLVAGVMRVSP